MSLTGFVTLVLYQVFYTWPRRQSLLIEVSRAALHVISCINSLLGCATCNQARIEVDGMNFCSIPLRSHWQPAAMALPKFYLCMSYLEVSLSLCLVLSWLTARAYTTRSLTFSKRWNSLLPCSLVYWPCPYPGTWAARVSIQRRNCVICVQSAFFYWSVSAGGALFTTNVLDAPCQSNLGHKPFLVVWKRRGMCCKRVVPWPWA